MWAWTIYGYRWIPAYAPVVLYPAPLPYPYVW
jgi:hypothetical protein